MDYLKEAEEARDWLLKIVVIGVLITIAALIMVGCTCAEGSVCGDGNIVGSSPVPSPTPVVFGSPDPCLVKSVNVGLFGGDQTPFLSLGQTIQLDATPMNDQGVVAKGCNLVRDPSWTTLTPLTCQVIGSGYNPFLRGLRVGSCSLTAMVSQVTSVPFSIEIR